MRQGWRARSDLFASGCVVARELTGKSGIGESERPWTHHAHFIILSRRKKNISISGNVFCSSSVKKTKKQKKNIHICQPVNDFVCVHVDVCVWVSVCVCALLCVVLLCVFGRWLMFSALGGVWGWNDEERGAA